MIFEHRPTGPTKDRECHNTKGPCRTILHHPRDECRAARAETGACSFAVLERTCELSLTVRWERLGCIVLTHTTSPPNASEPSQLAPPCAAVGHGSPPCDREGTSKMGIWYGVASEFTWRPYSNHACVSTHTTTPTRQSDDRREDLDFSKQTRGGHEGRLTSAR